MVRKIIISSVLAVATLAVSGCHHKAQNPLSNIDSKQPDKALFDRAMDAMKKAHYQEAERAIRDLSQRILMLGGVNVNTTMAEAWKAQYDSNAQTLKRSIERIEELFS